MKMHENTNAQKFNILLEYIGLSMRSMNGLKHTVYCFISERQHKNWHYFVSPNQVFGLT